MRRNYFSAYCLLLLLTPVLTWSQETYTFDRLLVYETLFEKKGKRGYLTSQLVNSKDNSYYALIRRNPKGGVELYFEHRGIGKCAYVDLAVNRLNDGDEVQVKKRLLKRLKKGATEMSWQQPRDTIVSGNSYVILSLDPTNPKDRKTQPLRFLLDKEAPDFQTNFWMEFHPDTWESSKGLPMGMITQVMTYNPFRYLLSNTYLKSQKNMSVRLIVN